MQGLKHCSTTCSCIKRARLVAKFAQVRRAYGASQSDTNAAQYAQGCCTHSREYKMKPMINGDRRTAIRNALKKHLTDDRLTAGKISRFVHDNQSAYGGEVPRYAITRFIDLAKGRVDDNTVLVIEQYLKDQAPGLLRDEIAARREAISGPTPRLLPAAHAFFRVQPKKVDQHRDAILGEFSFYAYSEREIGKVCRGALRFYVDKGGEASVQELQESIPEGSTETYQERFLGHFFFREKDMIVILRDKTRTIPKFYILSILSWKNMKERYTVMEGAILKVGEQKPVFSHNIYVIRDGGAFTKCNMLKLSDVKEEILQSLNSKRWGAPHEFTSSEGHW